MKNSISIILTLLLIIFISCTKKETSSLKETENLSQKKDSIISTDKQSDTKQDTIKEKKKINIDGSLNCSVKKNIKLYKSKDGKAKFKIEIPEISGLSDNKIQTKINNLLKTEFTSNIEGFGENMAIDNEKDMEKFAGELKEIKGTYDCDITSEITLNKNGILGVRLYYLGVQIPAAHPTHDFKGINLNLLTGDKVLISDIFKENINYNDIIEKFLNKDNQGFTDKNNPTFEFCITPKGIIIFNVYYGAGAAYELEIKFQDMKDVIVENFSEWK